MQNRKFYNGILLVFSFLILIFSLIASYGFFNPTKFSIFINSDTVSSYLIYKDLFTNGGDLHGWVMAAAPTFFPDLTLYMILASVTNASPLITPFLYSIVQITTICLLLIYIFRKSTPEDFRKYDFLIPLFFSCIFLESYYFSTDVFFGFLLCVPSYHCGAFVNALIALALFVSALRQGLKIPLFFIACVIGAFSDLLFIVMFTAPFILTMAFRTNKTNMKYQLVYILACVIASFIGIKIYHYIKETGLFIFAAPHRIYDFKNILPSFNVYVQQLSDYIQIPGFRSFAILFTLISSVVLFFVSIFSKQRKDKIYFILLFFAFFTFTVLPAPILNGNYTGYDTFRYNVHPFYLSFFIVAILVSVFLYRNKAINHSFFSLSLILLFGTALIVKLVQMDLKDYFDYYPKEVAEFDSISARYGLKRGVGDYWLAKKTTSLSKNGVNILAIYPEGNMAEFGSNINWYYEGSFNFIVSNGQSKETLDKYFKIKDTIKITDYDILLVEDFYYKRGEYFPSPLTK